MNQAVLNPERRKSIQMLEAELLKLEQAEVPVEHFFAPGMYARQMTLAAGITLTGAIHIHSHINTLSKGEALVTSEFGQEHIKAPHTWVSEPGIKRAIYALTDLVWTTYHATDSTDLAEIEEQMIAPNFEALPWLGGDK